MSDEVVAQAWRYRNEVGGPPVTIRVRTRDGQPPVGRPCGHCGSAIVDVFVSRDDGPERPAYWGAPLGGETSEHTFELCGLIGKFR